MAAPSDCQKAAGALFGPGVQVFAGGRDGAVAEGGLHQIESGRRVPHDAPHLCFAQAAASLPCFFRETNIGPLVLPFGPECQQFPGRARQLDGARFSAFAEHGHLPFPSLAAVDPSSPGHTTPAPGCRSHINKVLKTPQWLSVHARSRVPSAVGLPESTPDIHASAKAARPAETHARAGRECRERHKSATVLARLSSCGKMPDSPRRVFEHSILYSLLGQHTALHEFSDNALRQSGSRIRGALSHRAKSSGSGN